MVGPYNGHHSRGDDMDGREGLGTVCGRVVDRLPPLFQRRGYEPSEPELWAAECRSRRLSVWAAANLKRKFAIMRATGRPATGLLFCSRYHDRPNARAAVDLLLKASLGAPVHPPTAPPATAAMTAAAAATMPSLDPISVGGLDKRGSHASGGGGGEASGDRWLLDLTAWLTHRRDRLDRDHALIQANQRDSHAWGKDPFG